MSNNVYYVGSEPLTFERIEKILTENMRLAYARSDGTYPALP
jgi:hypothetical protein